MFPKSVTAVVITILAILVPSIRNLNSFVTKADPSTDSDGMDPNDYFGDGAGATCRG